ncbi:MAG: hypothetical protein YYHSYBAR_002614 [Candidatus Fervidibacter sacchari]
MHALTSLVNIARLSKIEGTKTAMVEVVACRSLSAFPRNAIKYCPLLCCNDTRSYNG